MNPVKMWSEVVLLLVCCFLVVVADMNDADQMDSEAGGSDGVSDAGEIGDGVADPNIINPQRGQGYGFHNTNPPWTSTTQPPRAMISTTPKPTFSQQSMRAVLEFGIIVGVAFLVGGMFMAMVGMEILYDKLVDKYYEVFKKPKVLPDVERLHPAELVGTFSRYK